MSGKVVKVSGPLVVATGLADANMSDVVRVGPQRLIGEILTMKGDTANIQVYEETSGLGPGAEVETTGAPMSVELGPGMIEGIYDGIQRPLPEIRDLTGSNITRGIEVPALNRERVWHFDPVVQPGAAVSGGDVIGTVQETTSILHKIMVPPQMAGTIKSITGGDFTVDQTVAVLTDAAGVDHELNMIQRWPVRIARPYAQKFAPNKPMNSGQRIIDTLFPIAKGGTAAVPGPFGSGKTVMTKQLSGPDGEITTTFEYDGIDRLVRVTDTEGNVTTSVYDMGDRRTEVNHPASGITTFTYDALGNVLTKQTANLAKEGKSITYDYDYHRLTGINYSDHPENNVKYYITV